jgi:DNA-binding transcriptional LysR family regulator
MLDALGSYTAAAKRLGVSKAAMSHRISELEQAAGVPLVRRTTRSVRLTEAGQQLAEATRDAFAEIERSFAGVRDLAHEPRGLLRLTAPVALGRQHIAPHLPAFLQTHPAIRIELELSDRLTSLSQEGFDVAIRHADVLPDSHVAWKLCPTRSVLAASRNYLRKSGTPESPLDLVNHNCLHYLRGGPAPSWSFEPASSTKRNPERLSVPVRGNFAANNSEVLRELALAGSGIALLPDFSVAAALKAGRLVQVLPGWRPVAAFGGHVFAICPQAAHIPHSVKALVSFLQQVMKQGFPS